MRKGRTGQKYIFSTEHMTIDALFDLFSLLTGQPKPAFRMPAGLMMGVAEISERVHRTLLPGRRQLTDDGCCSSAAAPIAARPATSSGIGRPRWPRRFRRLTTGSLHAA